MSMKSYKARGIVLHTLKYGDSGMVVYLLTDSGGRQSYMVQGVRSARGHGSKLALFQPMFAVEFEGLESSRMQMHRFREVRSGIVLQSLPFDVRKSTIALFMAEVLYRLVKECEPNQRLFDFVWGSVAALDALDEGVANFHLWRGSTSARVRSRRCGRRTARCFRPTTPASCTTCWSATYATSPRSDSTAASAWPISTPCWSTTATTSTRFTPCSR